MIMDEKMLIEIVNGCEGQSVYISDLDGSGYRVAGPKPWGGGTVSKKWEVKIVHILRAVGVDRELTQLRADNQAQSEILSQKDATIRLLTKRHKLEVADNKALRDKVEAERWIPVPERLPDDDSPHLFCLESGNVVQGIPSCELGRHNPPLTHKATHWKPITLPQSEVDANEKLVKELKDAKD